MKRRHEQAFEIDQDGNVIQKPREASPSPPLRITEPTNDTVFRDSSGRIVSQEELKARAAKRKAKKEAAQKLEWGRGLVQVQQVEDDALQKIRTSQAPLARYSDDEDMNRQLREEQRWGDPLLKHKHKTKKSLDISKVTTRPMYKGVPWSNRFNILPGNRWDGIDRTNGWEKRRLQIILNSQYQAASQEDYGVADD